MRGFYRYLTLLSVVASVLYSTEVSAQEEVMFKDGRRWVYMHRTSNSSTEDVSYFSYYASGDAVVDGKACKRVIRKADDGKETLMGYVREEGRRVYFKEDADAPWHLNYDFGLKAGDRFRQCEIEMRVMEIDTIRTEHGSFAQWHFCEEWDRSMSTEVYSYIEGIGCPGEDILFPSCGVFTPSEYVSLESCYDKQTLLMSWHGVPYSYWTYSTVRNGSRHGRTLYGDVETWSSWTDGPIELNDKEYEAIRSTCPGRTVNPAIRKEAGRVYMDYDQFMRFVSDAFPKAVTVQIPYPVTDGKEVVLYDFSLSENDPYPDRAKSDGLYVALKDTIQLRDMELRRRLILSNGMELIEGLGCVNSNGGYFMYLYDTDVLGDNAFTVLTGYTEARSTEMSIFDTGWLINPALDYYHQGTRWTELQLDTLQYDSWYTQVETKDGTRLVPNFRVVEYYVGDDCIDSNDEFPFQLKGIYVKRDNRADSLVCYLAVSDKQPFVSGMPVVKTTDAGKSYPTLVYNFREDGWRTGMPLSCGQAGTGHSDQVKYGNILSVDESYFDGKSPVTYADMTTGLRILKGIGVTQWKGSECILGPLCLKNAASDKKKAEPSHLKSILVQFERDGEIIYKVWPNGGGENGISHPNERATMPGKNASYDLQGRPAVKGTKSGIIIRNRRKILEK